MQVQCPVCFSNFDAGDMLHAGCGHRVCKDCLQSYLAAYVGDMAAVMHLSCAGDGACKVVTPLSLLRSVANQAQLKLLAEYEQRTLVDTNARASWCPKAGCQYIALCASRPPKHPTCAFAIQSVCDEGALSVRIAGPWLRNSAEIYSPRALLNANLDL